MSSSTIRAVPVAEVVRSGVVEGHHFGSVVALAPSGADLLVVGEVEAAMFARSSLKPLQALAMVRGGLELTSPQLAIACSSHSGQHQHVRQVLSVLAAHGLTVEDLGNVADLPIHEPSAHALLRSGGERDRLHMNCSGKHAAMVATCVVNGWPTGTYKDPAHPLQVCIRQTVEELCGERVEHVAVDGCGAPLLSTSLRGLARAFSRLVTAEPDSSERRIADAMRAHPHLVGGDGRDVTDLMCAVPGLLAKDGAEGVYAVALPDGRAVALKVQDGASRARMPVLAKVLERLGVDAALLAELEQTPVLGGGVRVGGVRGLDLVDDLR